jgi:hypothetical protein
MMKGTISMFASITMSAASSAASYYSGGMAGGGGGGGGSEVPAAFGFGGYTPGPARYGPGGAGPAFGGMDAANTNLTSGLDYMNSINQPGASYETLDDRYDAGYDPQG